MNITKKKLAPDFTRKLPHFTQQKEQQKPSVTGKKLCSKTGKKDLINQYKKML